MLLAEKIQIGKFTAKNRIVVPPMADFGQNDYSYKVNDRALKRYGKLASGGAGVLTIEACSVTPTRYERLPIDVSNDEALPGLKMLADATIGMGVMKAGTDAAGTGAAETSGESNPPLVLVQLINNGIHYMPENSLSELSREQLKAYQDDFVSAALRCKRTGFHGIELHAAHGYFLNQIIEEETGAIGYDGNLENRAKYISEVIAAIRMAAGDDFIISVRIGTSNPETLVEESGILESAGADLLSVSSGYDDYRTFCPEGFGFDNKIYAASLVKKAVSIPVICVGGIIEGSEAEAVLERGYADLVAVGRSQLADYMWASKVLSGTYPIPCRRCDKCLWFKDGKLCPALSFDFFD